LDLALLVDRQHHRVGRRIEVEADDIGHLLGKPCKRFRERWTINRLRVEKKHAAGCRSLVAMPRIVPTLIPDGKKFRVIRAIRRTLYTAR
jgi:hypothetical protein